MNWDWIGFVYLELQLWYRFNSCVLFFIITGASFSSFKRQPHFFEWTTNTWQKLIVWGCCPNSYNFGRLVIWLISMIFRLTSGQTPGEKKFEKYFIASKDPPSNFRGSLGVILIFDFIFWSGSPKNTLLSFKRQKRTQLLTLKRAFLNSIQLRLNDRELWTRWNCRG